MEYNEKNMELLLPRYCEGIATVEEQRLVKDWMREMSGFGEESQISVITKKPITAGNEELFINPRARSAKLRAAIKR